MFNTGTKSARGDYTGRDRLIHGNVSTIATSLPSLVPTVNPMSNYIYTIQYGGTLIQIAAKYGVNLNELTHLNGICNANHIYIGQMLRISQK